MAFHLLQKMLLCQEISLYTTKGTQTHCSGDFFLSISKQFEVAMEMLGFGSKKMFAEARGSTIVAESGHVRCV